MDDVPWFLSTKLKLPVVGYEKRQSQSDKRAITESTEFFSSGKGFVILCNKTIKLLLLYSYCLKYKFLNKENTRAYKNFCENVKK